jgi:hypothetical protein
MDRLEVYSKNLHQEVAEVKRLQKEITDIGDKERQKIGHDLHDDLCPHLIGIEGLGTVLKRKLESRVFRKPSRWRRSTTCSKKPWSRAGSLPEACARSTSWITGWWRPCMNWPTTFNPFWCGLHLCCEADILIRDNTVATHIFRIVSGSCEQCCAPCHSTEILIRLTHANGRFNLTLPTMASVCTMKVNTPVWDCVSWPFVPQ